MLTHTDSKWSYSHSLKSLNCFCTAVEFIVIARKLTAIPGISEATHAFLLLAFLSSL